MNRTSNNAIIGGLCGAIGDKLGIKRNYIRVFYTVLTISTGVAPGIIIYFGLCALIPKKDEIINNLEVNDGQHIFKENQSRINEVVEKINLISNTILDKQRDNDLVKKIISKFKDKILEFQKYSPQLEKQYFECNKYLQENDVEHLQESIDLLEEKIELSSNSVKINYINMLEQKKKRLKIIGDIKNNIEIIESKLYLVLDTIKNIEASILHAELQTQLEDDNYDNLQSQISILSESMTEISDILKKKKISLF